MHQSTFCTRCNQRKRGPNHVCQPSAVEKFERIKKEMAQREREASARDTS